MMPSFLAVLSSASGFTHSQRMQPLSVLQTLSTSILPPMSFRCFWSSTISCNVFCEAGVDVSPHETAESSEGPFQYLHFLRREGPQVYLGRAAPDQVCRPRVLDLDFEAKL